MVRMKFPLQHDHGANKTMIKMGKKVSQRYVIALVYFMHSTLTSGPTVIIHEFFGSHALMTVLTLMCQAALVHTHANTAVIALKIPKTSCIILCKSTHAHTVS